MLHNINQLAKFVLLTFPLINASDSQVDIITLVSIKCKKICSIWIHAIVFQKSFDKLLFLLISLCLHLY